MTRELDAGTRKLLSPPLSLECGFHLTFLPQRLLQGHSLEMRSDENTCTVYVTEFS